MRLIDADKLIATLLEEIPMAENTNIFKEMIENQLIVYDVDKVVEQLKNVSYERFGNAGMGGENVVNLDDTIEIVKAGGNNDNNL